MSDTNGNGERKRLETAIESTAAKWMGRVIMPAAGVLITAMAAYIGNQLVGKIEDQTGAISRLGEKVDSALDTVDKRLDALDVRVTRNETRLEALREPR